MAVTVLQIVDGEPQPAYMIASHFDGQTDAELLAAKAAGAEDKGWDVEWLDEHSFIARKIRWDPDRMCERHFTVI